MFKKLSIACLLAGAVAVGCAQHANAEKLTLTFDDKAEAKLFQPIVGNWKVSDGAYGVKFGKEAVAVTVFKQPFSDLKASVTLRVPGIDQHAGALVRTSVQGKSIRGYFVGYRTNGDSANLDVFRLDNLSLKTGDGSFVTLCSRSLRVKKPLEAQVAGIILKGSKFEISFNGDLACSFTDSTYQTGFFGFQAFGKKGESFQIEELTASGK